MRDGWQRTLPCSMPIWEKKKMPDRNDLDYVYFPPDDYDDEYDRYEDYFLETGNDPYGLFDDQQTRKLVPVRVRAILARVSRLKTRFLNWLHACPSTDVDDIPF
jgi:hypothetical protein